MKKSLLFMSMVLALSLTSTMTSAQMYISEILFAPDGDDESNEFIEIRGTASTTIAANTYLVFVEGDAGGSVGKTKMVFDLSGQSFGTNGYLAFVLDGHPYTTVAGAEIVTSDAAPESTEVEWERFSQFNGTSSSGLIEDVSENILLVTTTSALTGTGDDIDSNDDGVIDIAGWTIHDSVSLLDDDDALEYGYGKLIFTRNGISGTVYDDSFSTVVEIGFKGGYVGRIGESTGSTGSDWFAAATDDSPYGEIKSTSDLSFDELVVSEVGGDSFSSFFTATTYTTGTLTTGPLTDLTVDGSLTVTSADDFECHNLTINSGQTVTIESNGSIAIYGGFINNGTLLVESGGTLLTSAGKSIDAATFERTTEYSDGRYSFVGSPVVSDPSIIGSDLGSHVYKYNEATDFDADAGLARWENAMSDQLVPGMGYTQSFQQELTFTGVPNSGNVTIDITNTIAGSATEANRGWNLISNPYPASIDADVFIVDNTEIDGTVYFWDDGGSDSERGDNGDYLAWNALDGELTGPNSTTKFKGDIRSMQAFFVHVTDAANDATISIVFNEDQRKTGDNDDARFFRAESEQSFPKLRLSLDTQDGLYSNQTLIGLREDATLGVDRLYDALNFSVNSHVQLYSTISNKQYAIQGLPLESGVSTDLGFELNHTSNELALNVTEISGLEEGMTFILTDNLTGTKYDLTEVSSIDVFATSGENIDRFTVSYESNQVLSLIDQTSEIITYQYNDGVINVQLKDLNLEESRYEIYGMSGRMLLNGESRVLQNGSFNVPVSSLQGLYVLKVQISNDQVNTIKIHL